MQKVVANMALIQQLFQDTAIAANETTDNAALIAQLAQSNKTFLSIAYEASAMERALFDFNANDFALPNWRAFLQQAPEHSTQIHIGLGWAIAKRRIALEQVEAAIEPQQVPRVLDGVGYCEGTFKQRIAVKDMKIPDWLNDILRRGYDQGLGRSLWYTAKAEPETLMNLIAPFTENRKADLWRGVGIALAYVGGCDADTLEQIKTQCTPYAEDLAMGVTLAALSRKTANTINTDTELACRLICDADVGTVCAYAEQKPMGDYFAWLELLRDR